MAMQSGPDRRAPGLGGLRDTAAAFAAGAQALAASAAATLRETGVQFQIARMHGVLSQMTDAQLRELGVDRDGLRQRASDLVLGRRGAGATPERGGRT